MMLILTTLIFSSALVTICSHYLKKKRWFYIFKPLTTFLIFILIAAGSGFHLDRYARLIAAGMIFSLAGDVFLMLPKGRFIQGLVSFLIAHLFYMTAFFSQTEKTRLLYWPLLLLLIYGAVVFALLFRFLKKYTRPVLLYMLVIIIMAWQAWEMALGSRIRVSAAAGALLFVFSDSILAWIRFRRPFHNVEAIKLGLYFTAQWLIALSAGG